MSIVRSIWTVMAVLVTTASAALGGGAPDPISAHPASLGIAVVAGPDEATAVAHLATSAGVVVGAVDGGVAVGVFGLGVGPRGRTLFYGHAADIDPPELPDEPKKPPKGANKLVKDLYEAAMKKWRLECDKLIEAWKADRRKAAAKWAVGSVAGLGNSSARSHNPVTNTDVELSVLRATDFFSHEGGKPMYVVIGDLPDRPPTARSSNSLAGATVVLADWTYASPKKFRSKVARWKGYFASQGAAFVRVLPRGISTTENIVSALR